MIWGLKGIIWDWMGTLLRPFHPYGMKEDMIELVRKFHKLGLWNSIATRNKIENVEIILKKEGIFELFTDNSIWYSTKAELIKNTLKIKKVDAKHVFYIDDKKLALREVKREIPRLNVLEDTKVRTLLQILKEKGDVNDE
tara:strand:+ start:4925 stop:5344 length:420 start_codon:yes stop_codon:yes gene_type:complete